MIRNIYKHKLFLFIFFSRNMNWNEPFTILNRPLLFLDLSIKSILGVPKFDCEVHF